MDGLFYEKKERAVIEVSATPGLPLKGRMRCVAKYFIMKYNEPKENRLGTFQTLVLVSYLMLLILPTYGLALMVNKRLLMSQGKKNGKDTVCY
jgi:hypothetical protein